MRDEGCDGGDDDSDDAKLSVRSINDIQTTVYVYRDSIYNSRVGPKAWKVGYMKGWLITTISSFWIPDGNYTGGFSGTWGHPSEAESKRLCHCNSIRCVVHAVQVVKEGRHDMSMEDDWAACAFPMHGACFSHIFLLSRPSEARR